MSSNPTNIETRRLKSIRRQLASRTIGQKIGVNFGNNFLIFLIIMCAWFGSVEYATTGSVDLKDRGRRITRISTEAAKQISDEDLKAKKDEKNSIVKIFFMDIENIDEETRYQVYDRESKEVLVDIRYFRGMMGFIVILLALFIIQMILHWISYPTEAAYVKKVLKPLDEMAIKADEFAKMDFSEDKYQIIEDRLSSMEPDTQKRISFGDKDLMGIENAMNSLMQRIHESNQQQARFVNDASHELRTPIAVIQGYANMLARWGREDEKVLDESITAIQNESDNMKHLVEQLLFLARGDAGRTVVNPQKVSLNSIMREVYEESLMIDENHIYRLTTLDEDPMVMADEGLIKQAVRILVDNAAKYTKEKDEILLSVGVKDDSTAYIQVQDTGIGMKAADVEHMFERFYRADEARTFNGTGLGLSIAKWIVDKHKGHFEIVSREELGTRIGIYLPRV